MKQKILQAMFAVLVCAGAHAQINTGSTGSDGALDFSSITNSTNIVIDMHDHPNGIYQYVYVNIPNTVTVAFIPNASNTPVVWLVQSNVTVGGTVDVSGGSVAWDTPQGGSGGPAGFRGGNGTNSGVPPTAGAGPGGGGINKGGSFGTSSGGGSVYGNTFLIPLIGGSGAGGSDNACYTVAEGGGGGGGAILIAAGGAFILNGTINASGGSSGNLHCGYSFGGPGAGGSGGAVRLVAAKLTGVGSIAAGGGGAGCCDAARSGGAGRIRLDIMDDQFGGTVSGNLSQGFQPIIIPTNGQLPQLTIMTVGGVSVSPSPTGVIATPDALLSAVQTNPIPVVVRCSNLALNSPVTVSVKPVNGPAVAVLGYNSSGTLSSSTATVLLNVPRGGGLMYATAAVGN
jgi:hypothetical protein